MKVVNEFIKYPSYMSEFFLYFDFHIYEVQWSSPYNSKIDFLMSEVGKVS